MYKDRDSERPPVEIPVVKWTPTSQPAAVRRLLERAAFVPEAEDAARKVLEDVARRGDAAVAECAARFDGVDLPPMQFAVTKAERMAAIEGMDAEFKRAVSEAIQRIAKFARAGLRKDWHMLSPKGGILGEQFMPLDRVGCYIPGGASPLASTALMTVVLAKVAGVPEIVACTPSDKQGGINPHVLYALDAAGATEIYRIGGIQAIAAMALGTDTIPRVQKIVGPGGPYVTAAKRLVYGLVDLDLVAGPSEVAILADETAQPGPIAADLLAQAEHGTGHEKAPFVTPHAPLAHAVSEQLVIQCMRLPRAEVIARVLQEGTVVCIVDNLDSGMDLCNLFAPEHFEIMVREPRNWLKKVRRAGAVFVGPWTPECAGDFVAGPSHVLPTGGMAAVFSGLTVDSFRRRTSYIQYTRADLQDVLPFIETFARVEDLEAHARSARIRFDRP